MGSTFQDARLEFCWQSIQPFHAVGWNPMGVCTQSVSVHYIGSRLCSLERPMMFYGCAVAQDDIHGIHGVS
jgi:hypothetical protein